jgi:hypothetical protein
VADQGLIGDPLGTLEANQGLIKDLLVAIGGHLRVNQGPLRGQLGANRGPIGGQSGEEPFSQTEAMEKVDDISAEVDDFKEALENHIEGCDVLKVKTEPDDSSSNSSCSVLTFSTSQPSTSSSKTSLE